MKNFLGKILVGSVIFVMAVALFSCSVVPELIIPSDGDSNGNNNTNDNTNVGVITRFTITSPANGSSVCVPFTISGTKSTNVETVSLSYPTKDAQINGSNWTITINTNDVGMGNLQFTLQAKDKYLSILSNISIVLNVTNNGTGDTIGHIVGQMTNHFSSEWKIYFDYISKYYGTVDGSGNFDIPISTGIPSKGWIYAFKDANGNDICEDDEYIVCAIYTNVALGDVSNVYINIPDLTLREISGNVTGNIFGLPLGILIRHTFSGSECAYYCTAPNTSENFSYSITVSGVTGDDITVGYYIDDNSDGEWTCYDLASFIFESRRFDASPFFAFPDSDTNIDMHLCGKMIKGAITGNGAANFNCVWMEIGGGERVYTTINSGNYSCGFYIYTNETIAPMINFVEAFIDQNANIIFDSYEKSVSHTNGFPFGVIGDGTVVTTNTRDFVIDKITHVGIIEGNAAAEFKLAKDFGMGMYWDVQDTPYSWVDYIFQGATTFFQLTAFIDVNANEKYDFLTDTSFCSSWEEPNNSVVTNKFFIQRGIVDLTIDGSYAGFTHPMISYKIGTKTLYWEIDSSASSVTNYWETNGGAFSAELFTFDDTNENNSYSAIEPYATTNTDGNYKSTWSDYVATTNFTLYITN